MAITGRREHPISPITCPAAGVDNGYHSMYRQAGANDVQCGVPTREEGGGARELDGGLGGVLIRCFP